MTPSTSKPTLAGGAIRYLGSEHGLFLIAMAIVAGVLLALGAR